MHQHPQRVGPHKARRDGAVVLARRAQRETHRRRPHRMEHCRADTARESVEGPAPRAAGHQHQQLVLEILDDGEAHAARHPQQHPPVRGAHAMEQEEQPQRFQELLHQRRHPRHQQHLGGAEAETLFKHRRHIDPQHHGHGGVGDGRRHRREHPPRQRRQYRMRRGRLRCATVNVIEPEQPRERERHDERQRKEPEPASAQRQARHPQRQRKQEAHQQPPGTRQFEARSAGAVRVGWQRQQRWSHRRRSGGGGRRLPARGRIAGRRLHRRVVVGRSRAVAVVTGVGAAVVRSRRRRRSSRRRAVRRWRTARDHPRREAAARCVVRQRPLEHRHYQQHPRAEGDERQHEDHRDGRQRCGGPEHVLAQRGVDEEKQHELHAQRQQ